VTKVVGAGMFLALGQGNFQRMRQRNAVQKSLQGTNQEISAHPFGFLYVPVLHRFLERCTINVRSEDPTITEPSPIGCFKSPIEMMRERIVTALFQPHRAVRKFLAI